MTRNDNQRRPKGPQALDILYLKAFALPFTVNTTLERTLKALATHTELGRILATIGGDREEVLAQIAESGIDLDALAVQL